MADKKISALTSLAQGDVAVTTDVLPIVDTSATETKKVTAAALVGAGLAAGVTSVDINSGAIDGTTIGASTASTGSFTTLTTSSTVTLNGGTANGVLYLDGSKVATSGSAFVFDGTNVGIGTSSPAYKFDLNAGTGVNIAARFVARSTGTIYCGTNDTGIFDSDGSNGWSVNEASDFARVYTNAIERLRITSTGNVGIGTTSPKTLFNVTGSGSTGAILTLENSNAGTTTNDVIGKIDFYSNDTTLPGAGAKANIVGLVTSSGGTSVGLTFGTSDGSSSTAIERMRITSTGDVGIGTSSPTYKLEVSAATDVAQFIATDAGASGAQIQLFHDSASPANDDVTSLINFSGRDSAAQATIYSRVSGISTNVTNGSESGAIAFSTRNLGTFAERMRLTSAGALLLGQTATAAYTGNASSIDSGQQIAATSAGAAALSINRYGNVANGAQIVLAHSRGAAVGTNTIVASGDPLGIINFNGANGTGYDIAAQIRGEVDDTPGASADMPGRLTFYTTPNASATPAERMRIDSAGQVGVGITPSAWQSSAGARAVQVGLGALSYNGSGNTESRVTHGAYFDGTNWKYNLTGVGAARYTMTGASAGSTHSWSVSAGGTADNNITFTQAMTLTSAGELQVGGTTALNAAQGNLTIERANSDPTLALFRNDTSISSTESLGKVGFYGNDTTSNTPTLLAYTEARASGTHSGGDNTTDLVFGTTPNNSATVAEAGRVTQAGSYVLKGGTTTAAAGVGIIFPATQVASANANSLDDYEEGSFTPSWSSSGASFSYQAERNGRYIKIGRCVYFSIYISTSSAPSGTTSNSINISGLPFTSADDDAANNAMAVSFGMLYNVNWPANKIAATTSVNRNATTIALNWEQDSATTASWIASDLLADCYVKVAGCYIAAS